MTASNKSPNIVVCCLVLLLAAMLIGGCVPRPNPIVTPGPAIVPAALIPPKVVPASKRVTSAIVVPPPPARTNLLLSWDHGTNRSMIRVWFTPNLNRPMTVLTNTLSTNYSTTIPSGIISGFFRISAASNAVMLAWNPSASTNVAGYKIYFWQASQSCTNALAVGNVTNTFVSGLVAGQTYCFAATAIDVIGDESPFSNEVVWKVPTSPLEPLNLRLILR